MKAFVADNTLDATAFVKAATGYARSKGCKDEDIPSTMLLHALEMRERSPGQLLSMDLIWRKAYETLHPRGSNGKGGRERRDALDHTVDDTRVMPDGEEIRTSECTVIDFGAHYTAIASTRGNAVAARSATADLRRARYLARLPFGHLPFIL